MNTQYIEQNKRERINTFDHFNFQFKMNLLKSEIWNVYNIDSLVSFNEKFVSNIVIHNNCPEDVRAELETAKKLILHSYYEYEFLDIALTHTIFTLEKALRLKWLNIHKSDTKKTLQNLIDWFFDNGYFETYNVKPLHQLRDIRNGKVHETIKSLGGALFIQKIKSATRFIYDLYEDEVKRKQRKEDIENIIKLLEQIDKDGCILELNNKRYIIFKIIPLFLNNKKVNNILHIACIPIFDLEKISDGKNSILPIELSLLDWEIINSYLKGIDISSNQAILITSIDEKNKERFLKWRDELDKLADKELLLSYLEYFTECCYTRVLDEYYIL